MQKAAARLGTVKRAPYKLRAPWGIWVELNLKSRLLSIFLFVLQTGWGGSAKMLQRLFFQGSAWISSVVQQNPFFCTVLLLLSNYCISQSMQRLDLATRSTTAEWAWPLFDVSLHQWFETKVEGACEEQVFLWCNFLKSAFVFRISCSRGRKKDFQVEIFYLLYT